MLRHQQDGAFGRPEERRGRGWLAALPHVVQRNVAVVAWCRTRNASESARLAEAGVRAPASPWALSGTATPPESSRVWRSAAQSPEPTAAAPRGRGGEPWRTPDGTFNMRPPPERQSRLTEGAKRTTDAGASIGTTEANLAVCLGGQRRRARRPWAGTRAPPWPLFCIQAARTLLSGPEGRPAHAGGALERGGGRMGCCERGPFDHCCELGQCGRDGAHVQEPKHGGAVARRHRTREVRRALVASRRIECAAAHSGQPAAGRWEWGWG